MRFLFCLFTPLLLFALGVRDFTIASDDKKIEIIFLLDSTFNNSVSRKYSNTFGAIILENTIFNQKKVIERTKLIKRVEIFQKNNDLYIVFAENDFDLKYSIDVLSSNRILKIIVNQNESIASNLMANTTARQPSLENAISAIKNNSVPNNYITTKSPLELETWRYVAVILVLSTLLIVLIIVKKKMQIKNNDSKEFSYFKKTNKSNDTSLVDISSNNGVGVSKIINIDLKNKIIVLDGKDYKYLLFIGEHNSFIIDRIQNDEFDEDISFNKLLEMKEARLPSIIKDYKNEKD